MLYLPLLIRRNKGETMATKQQFTATTWQEDGGWIAQTLEIDIASQGDTEEEALANLKEALELHFEPPTATILPTIHTLEIELATT
jgi:predicted RNase H-like HicB family nuclease